MALGDDPHCCAPASFSFRIESFTNVAGAPNAQIGNGYYDEQQGSYALVMFGNDTYQVYSLPTGVYVVNVTDGTHKCTSIQCTADVPCFQRYCTNATDWNYKGLIIVGTEKASQWTMSGHPGNFILQMLQSDKTRCIPIAFTMARGQTAESLEYAFTWWSNLKPASIPPSLFVPPATCSHTRAERSVSDLKRDHPQLLSLIRSVFVR